MRRENIGPRLKRPCNKCGKMFSPDGKYQRYCNKCKEKFRELRGGMRYDKKGRKDDNKCR